MADLPKAIQAQLDEAERLMQPGEAPEPGKTPDPNETPPPPDPQPVPAKPDAAPAAVVDDESYQRKYEILQGKYNAEVPRLQQQLRDLSHGYLQLQQELQRLREKPVEPPKPEPALVTSQDEERFGSDLVDMVRRVAREELRAVQQRFDAVDAAIRRLAPQAQRVEQVAQDVAATRESTFYVELERAVPDYKTVNVDNRWLAWLAEFDPIAGKTRQQALDEAAAVYDHRRVAAMFSAFKATLPAAPDKGQSELARQVAPSRSSTVAQTPPGKKIYTGADYVYWTDPRRVHDKPRKEVETMLAELELAVMEGRVKWS